jgi:hypothetical protein
MYARVSTVHAMLLPTILLADLSQVPYAAYRGLERYASASRDLSFPILA